ncbi:MAG: hypothetical protein ABIN94_10615 [Ferruginibacter sp.]
MKNSLLLYLIAILIINSSFHNHSGAPGKIYNFFYIDNSHTKNYQSFSPEMFELVERKVDSLKGVQNSYLGFFLSNGLKPDFASNYKGSKSIINKLTNGYTNVPNSFFDKSLVIDNILNSDLSYTNGINFYFFVTESYLVNDLMGTNAGLLFNSLPGEMKYLLGCEEEKISVTIYYPAASKKVQLPALQKFCDFTSVHNIFRSKIKYHFQPI